MRGPLIVHARTQALLLDTIGDPSDLLRQLMRARLFAADHGRQAEAELGAHLSLATRGNPHAGLVPVAPRTRGARGRTG
jgi:hypothetical protein